MSCVCVCKCREHDEVFDVCMYLAASLVFHILFPAFRRLRGKKLPYV